MGDARLGALTEVSEDPIHSTFFLTDFTAVAMQRNGMGVLKPLNGNVAQDTFVCIAAHLRMGSLAGPYKLPSLQSHGKPV